MPARSRYQHGHTCWESTLWSDGFNIIRGSELIPGLFFKALISSTCSFGHVCSMVHLSNLIYWSPCVMAAVVMHCFLLLIPCWAWCWITDVLKQETSAIQGAGVNVKHPVPHGLRQGTLLQPYSPLRPCVAKCFIFLLLLRNSPYPSVLSLLHFCSLSLEMPPCWSIHQPDSKGPPSGLCFLSQLSQPYTHTRTHAHTHTHTELQHRCYLLHTL